jgi:parallel beta-helix repeat protein
MIENNRKSCKRKGQVTIKATAFSFIMLALMIVLISGTLFFTHGNGDQFVDNFFGDNLLTGAAIGVEGIINEGDIGIAASCGGEMTCACGALVNSSLNLTGDVTGCFNDGIIANASDIIIDCKGYTISPDPAGTGSGILVLGNTTVTIQNCTIINFDDGVYFQQGAHNGSVTNSTINTSGSSDDAIRADNTNGLNITGNNLHTKGSSARGVHFSTSNGTISHNTINTTGNTGEGIRLSGSVRSILDGNNITVDGGDGIFVTSSDYNNITNNNITQYDGADEGIDLNSANYNRVVSNIITKDGIIISSFADNNTIESNKILDGVITIAGANNTIFSNELFTSGISITDDFNNISNNNITAWGTDGISFNTGHNNTMFKNKIETNATNGHGFDVTNSNNNFISTNNVTTWGSGADGIYFSGTSNRTIIHNNNLTSNQSNSIDDASTDATHYLIYNTTLGEIRWTDKTFLGNMDLIGDIGLGINLHIGNNSIALNTSNFTTSGSINGSAEIRLYNLSFTGYDIYTLSNYTTNASHILSAGYMCPAANCSVLSTNGSEVKFNTTHFSSFSVNPDNTAPNIGAGEIQDQTLIQNQSIILNATITDNDNVTRVFFEIQPFGNVTADNTSNNWSIVCNATNQCNTTNINEFNWTGIWANDTANNMNYSNPDIQFNVSANAAPAIGTASINDTIVLQNDSVNFTVSITDDFSIDTVLFNLVDQGNITASNNTQTDFFIICGNVSSLECSTENISSINLTRIWVNDTNGQNTTLEPGLNFSIVSPESEAPVFTSDLAVNVTVTGKNGSVKINVSVTDDTGVDNVMFQIMDFGNVSAQNVGDEWFITCNATNHCNTTRAAVYNVSAIWAGDGSGNTNGTFPGTVFNVSEVFCGDTRNDDNGVITLNTSMYDCTERIILTGSNITLDCQGHTIDGNFSSDGIEAQDENITIKNCVIQEFQDAFYLRDIAMNITNNTINNHSGNLIKYQSFQNSTITYNNISNIGATSLITSINIGRSNYTFSYNNILDSNSTINWDKNSISLDLNNNWWENTSCTNITQRLTGDGYHNFTHYLNAESPDGVSTACPAFYCSIPIFYSTNLTQDITNCTTTGLNIKRSNMTLDCRGFNISSTSGSGTGISASDDDDNVTVQNCFVDNFETGITIGGDQSLYQNNTLRNNSIGISGSCTNCTITDHNLTGNNNSISSTGAINMTFYNIHFFNTTTHQIKSLNGDEDNFTIVNSTVDRTTFSTGIGTTVYVDSYIEVNVTDDAGNPVEGANITITNSLQEVEDKNTTNVNGFGRLEVSQYFTNNDVNNIITPATTIIVTKGNYTSNVTNISILDVPNTRLNFSITQITCDSNITSDFTLANNYSCGHGFRITGDNVTINGQGNRIIGNGSGLGIWLDNVTNVTIANISLINHSVGLSLLNVNNSNFYNLELINNTKYGALFNQSHNNTIFHTNITNNSIHAVNDGGTVNYLYNSSLEPSNITINGTAVVYFGWFVTINNTFSNGLPLSGATDTGYFNSTSEVDASAVSVDSGIVQLALIEFKKNSSETEYLTPHNITMLFTEGATIHTNSTVLNLTETTNTNINLSANLACTVPTSDLNITTSITLCPGTYDLTDEIQVGAENITVTCFDTTLREPNNAFQIADQNNVTIQHCNFIRTSTSSYLSSLYISNSNDTKIINNTFNSTQDKRGQGIYVAGWAAKNRTMHRFNITGNTFTNFDYGIWVEAIHNSSIYNNTFHSNDDAIYLDDGGNNTLYHNNFSDDNNYYHKISSSNNNSFNISVNITGNLSAQGNAYESYCNKGIDNNGDGYADNFTSLATRDWPMNDTVDNKFSTSTESGRNDYGPLIQTCVVGDVLLGSSGSGSGSGEGAGAGGGPAPAGPGAGADDSQDDTLDLEEEYFGADDVLANVDFTELENGFSLFNKGDKTLQLDNVVEGEEESVQTIFQSLAIVDSTDRFGTGWILQGDISEENLVRFLDEAKESIELRPGETTEITANNVLSSKNKKLSLVIKEANSGEDVKRIEKDIDAELTLAVDQPQNGFVDIYFVIPAGALRGKHYFEINVYKDEPIEEDTLSMRSFLAKIFTGNLWGSKLLYTETHGPRFLDEGFTVGKQYAYGCMYNGVHRINMKILNEAGQEVESKGYPLKLQCER